MKNFQVAIFMGSKSDLETMQHAINALKEFEVPYSIEILSAHRTPCSLSKVTCIHEQGVKVIIAGAGGAAHLPGMLASYALIPVIGVPVPSKYLSGVDSLYSIVQMPKGVGVACMAIGESGAFNAGLMAAQIVALHCPETKKRIKKFKCEQKNRVLEDDKDIKGCNTT